jgi:hypothetical protein
MQHIIGLHSFIVPIIPDFYPLEKVVSAQSNKKIFPHFAQSPAVCQPFRRLREEEEEARQKRPKAFSDGHITQLGKEPSHDRIGMDFAGKLEGAAAHLE